MQYLAHHRAAGPTRRRRSLATWNIYSGRQRSEPTALQSVRGEADSAEIVREASASGQSIRVVGAGHSHAPLALTDGAIVDAAGLVGIVGTDAATRSARVRSGTRIYALGRALRNAGLPLVNHGDIDRQAIAGAIATSTHGTGVALNNLTAAVTALRLNIANREIVECSQDANYELFRAARLNLRAAPGAASQRDQLRTAQERSF